MRHVFRDYNKVTQLPDTFLGISEFMGLLFGPHYQGS